MLVVVLIYGHEHSHFEGDLIGKSCPFNKQQEQLYPLSSVVSVMMSFHWINGTQTKVSPMESESKQTRIVDFFHERLATVSQ